ncbi:MAG: Lrp/AsnC family transcriptional regulator [Woeseia sp.]|nr:Lrp/AsnC family transcriptional regulator [Woeseia sp.]
MKTVDATDQQLLSLLRNNARTPVVELARQLGVSRATVQNRMRRLERDGVIRGYSVSVATDQERPVVRALMSISSENADEANVIKRLRGNPNVTAVHHTTGRWDLIAEIHADSLASFNTIVGNLRLIDGVTATETNLLLDSYE